jgi:hypothetical protein
MSITQENNSINGNGGADFIPAPKQLQLWDQPGIDPTMRLKAAMREALHVCVLSREKVVSDMNALALIEGMTCGGKGQKVTEALLDKWCAAGSTAYIIPARFIPLFCKVVGSALPLKALAGPVGAEVITAEDLRLLSWARVELARRRLERDALKLAREVGINE